VLVPRSSGTPVATWDWPTWVVSRRRVLEAAFILLEFSSPSRRIFIGSHSLPPLWFDVSVLQFTSKSAEKVQSSHLCPWRRRGGSEEAPVMVGDKTGAPRSATTPTPARVRSRSAWMTAVRSGWVSSAAAV
jgi:hypothetical protein